MEAYDGLDELRCEQYVVYLRGRRGLVDALWLHYSGYIDQAQDLIGNHESTIRTDE